MKSLFVFFLIIIGFSKLNAQSECLDTVIFMCKEKNFDKVKFSMDEVLCYRGKLFHKYNLWSKIFGHPFETPHCDSQNLCSGAYFKFYDGKKLIAEGNWDWESFNGIYKRYYKNGQLKAEGTYLTECKVGVWKFYNKQGKLIGSKTYPKKCINEKGQEYLSDEYPK
tara:strand:+ start:68 stop:565 length:498 start_codon:yes stop_codon:yes gene_type:complete